MFLLMGHVSIRRDTIGEEDRDDEREAGNMIKGWAAAEDEEEEDGEEEEHLVIN